MSQIVETWAEYKGSRYNATYSEETQSWDVDIPAGAVRAASHLTSPPRNIA